MASASRLETILEVKRGEIARLNPCREKYERQAALRKDFRGFHRALRQADGLALIAEVKKASPSAGVIAAEFDPVAQARAYEAAGAHAVSVLTDATFFGGSIEDMREVREAVRLPVLRKDFILEEGQIFEAAAWGADAVLLIAAALDQERLEGLLGVAGRCGLDVLVEVHTAEELDGVLAIGTSLIGINNRDLRTFEVDLGVTERLAERAARRALLVSESGIRSGADAARVRRCGVGAILVGETLMRSSNVAETVKELLGTGVS